MSLKTTRPLQNVLSYLIDSVLPSPSTIILCIIVNHKSGKSFYFEWFLTVVFWVHPVMVDFCSSYISTKTTHQLSSYTLF